MARGLNKCEFIGNAGRDPEVKRFANGGAITSLSIGCSNSWKDKEGEQHEETEWVNLVFGGGLADIAAKYVKKGSRVYVSGRLKTRKYADKSGAERYFVEVHVADMLLLDGKPEGERKPLAPQQRPIQQPQAEEFRDDDIPF